jgi:hypothetical protein
LKREIDIVCKSYDQNNTIVFFECKGEDIGFEFALCEFVSEMNHWNLPTRIVELNGKRGFIFSKHLSKEDIEMEILRFIKHNALDEELATGGGVLREIGRTGLKGDKLL